MCPPCKVILDCGGVLPASLRLLADSNANLAGPARYYASIAEAGSRAIIHAVDNGFLKPAGIDEAHAWSELSCHRAKAVRAFIANGRVPVPNQIEDITPDLLMAWAEEHRLFATGMVGGEYNEEKGGFTIDGVTGIVAKKKEK